jgi:hypothetical protein
MTRLLAVLVVAMVVPDAMVVAQSAKFPDSPQGRLAAAFFAAANAPDEDALFRFQEANFTEAALRRRPPEERHSRNRELREMVGRLTLITVTSASASRIVAKATGTNAPGTVWTVTITFTGGAAPKIDAIQITPS